VGDAEQTCFTKTPPVGGLSEGLHGNMDEIAPCFDGPSEKAWCLIAHCVSLLGMLLLGGGALDPCLVLVDIGRWRLWRALCSRSTPVVAPPPPRPGSLTSTRWWLG